MIFAWHNEPKLKAAAMARLREHRRMDAIVKGVYWNNGRGCQLGCLTHSSGNPHEDAQRLFGLPLRVGYWLESVFEGLPEHECEDWVLE